MGALLNYDFYNIKTQSKYDYIWIIYINNTMINYNNITKITKYLNNNNIKYQIIFPYHYNKPYLKINLNN